MGEKLGEKMKKRKIAIFGSGGMLGQDLCKNAPSGVQILAYKREMNINHFGLIQKRLQEDQPDFVINSAAFNDVDGAQGEGMARAHRVNFEGPKNLAHLCQDLKIPLLHFSTDYVFSDRKGAPVDETDPVEPLSEYAFSKYKGEEAVRKNEQHYILRVSTLYGKGRANHALRVLDAIKNQKAVGIVTDLHCSPSFTGDLARWVFDLVEKEPPFGTYHLCHKGVCTRWDFAVALCRQVGVPQPFPLKKVSLKELHLAAPRPLRVQMKTEKWEKHIGPLLTWNEGLTHFLSELNMPISTT